jgi:hypothetical protein
MAYREDLQNWLCPTCGYSPKASLDATITTAADSSNDSPPSPPPTLEQKVNLEQGAGLSPRSLQSQLTDHEPKKKQISLRETDSRDWIERLTF